MSAGNVLGSNTFYLLVAIPAGVLVAGSTMVDYDVAAPLMAFLCTAATITLFATLRTDLTLSARAGRVLLGLYTLFVLWLALQTTEGTTILGAAGPGSG